MEPLFFTNNNNIYYYNNNSKVLVYIHPILYSIIRTENSGNPIDIKTLAKEFPLFSIENIEYYQRKYVYMKKYIFQESQPIETEFNRYTPNDIIQNLANSSQLVFEITTKCNMKCAYCAYGECYDNLEYSPNDTPTFAKAKNIIDYLFNIWNSKNYVSFNKRQNIGFYGGEAFLNIKLIEDIIYYVDSKAAESNIIFKYSMTTNAILLDKYMDFLVKHDFNLLISLDGNEFNNGYRVLKNNLSSYNIVLNNINKLRKKYPKYFERNVSFNSVLHNKNSVNEIYSFFKQQFNKKPSIGELTSSEIDKNKMDKFNRMYKSMSKDMDVSNNEVYFENSPIIRNIFSFLYHYSGDIYKDYYHFLLKHPQKEILMQTGTCPPFTKKIYISCDGKILPCEKVSHKYALGEVTDKCVNINPGLIAKKYNQIFEILNHQCNRCHGKMFCGKCFFFIDKIDSNHPKCNAYMDLKNFYYTFGRLLGILEHTPSIYNNILKIKLS